MDGKVNTDPNYELEKLSIEKEKLAIEREKVQLERMKARWSAFSIVVPLLAASFTIIFGIWSNNQQARNQLELNKNQEKNQFELKAAEIVMNSKSPYESLNRSRALAALFPERLPDKFSSNFDPEKFSRQSIVPPEARIDLFRALQGKDKKQQTEILEIWNMLFDGSKEGEDEIDKKEYSNDERQYKKALKKPFAGSGGWYIRK